MHWFDTREGKLIVGEAAYEQAMEQSIPSDIMPLVDILTAKEFDIDTAMYDRPKFSRTQSREDMVTYGQWLLNVLSEADEPVDLATAHFERLGKLGLGSGIGAVRTRLGKSIWDIGEAIGANKNFARIGTYDDWSEFDFIENAERLAETLRMKKNPKPSDLDYEEWARDGHGPSPTVIRSKIGYSTREMNELIGFPNVHDWDKEKYLDWGVEVMTANDGASLIRPILKVLSERRRGPSLSAIVTKFGNLSTFQALAEDRYNNRLPTSAEPDIIPQLEKHVELLCAHFGKHAPQKPATKLALAARFEVARRLIPGLSNSEYAQIAFETNSGTFIGRLLEENYYLSPKRVRASAHELGYDDFIWPQTKRNQRRLHVSPQALAKARRQHADYERNIKRARRERERLATQDQESA